MGSEALTYTVALGSPAGAIVLYLYARSIRLLGPQSTLRISEFWCILLKILVFLLCSNLSGLWGQAIVVFYYSFREM